MMGAHTILMEFMLEVFLWSSGRSPVDPPRTKEKTPSAGYSLLYWSPSISSILLKLYLETQQIILEELDFLFNLIGLQILP